MSTVMGPDSEKTALGDFSDKIPLILMAGRIMLQTAKMYFPEHNSQA